MARSGRSSAGDRVRRRAAAYSRVLLDRELACFAAVDAAFAARVGAGERLVRARWAASHGQAVYDAPLRDGLARLGLDALAVIRPAVYRLAVDAAALGVVSIGGELKECEDAVAARYFGSARAGEETALARSGGLADAAVGRFGLAEATVSTNWRQAAARQLQFAAQYGEPVAQAAARLFDPGPVGVRGCSGAGAWWAAAGQLKAACRELAVGVGNRVRSAGMEGFNTAYQQRAPLSPPAAGSAVPRRFEAGTGP